MVSQHTNPFFYRVFLLFLLFLPGTIQAQAESTDISPEIRNATENNEVFLQTTISKDQVYVQEALIYSIKLYYTLAFERGASFSRLEMPEAAFNKLGDDLNYTETVDGTLYTVNESRFVIFPQTSGEFTIAPVRFRAFTQTRATRNNPNLQTTERRQTIELSSQEHRISVSPVPVNYPSPNWIPSSQVSISETWSRSLQDMRIGDSVVRSIELNAEDIYASMLTNLDFTSDSALRYYPAEAQQVDITENSGVRSIHTQNITLVATEAGRFTLPAVEIPWWNTVSNRLEYASLPAQDLDILTVDGQQVEPVAESPGSNEPANYFWFSVNLNLLLFLGALLLLSTLFFGPALLLVWAKLQNFINHVLLQKKTKVAEHIQKLPDINLSFQKLSNACEHKNIRACAESFLLWGQAYFQNQALYNIEKLNAEFNHNALESLLQELQTCLYAEENTKDFNFENFLQIVTALHKNRKSKMGKVLPYNLPPLYKN